MDGEVAVRTKAGVVGVRVGIGIAVTAVVVVVVVFVGRIILVVLEVIAALVVRAAAASGETKAEGEREIRRTDMGISRWTSGGIGSMEWRRRRERLTLPVSIGRAQRVGPGRAEPGSR